MVRQNINCPRPRTARGAFDQKVPQYFCARGPFPVLVLTLKMFRSVPISKLPQLVYETQQDIESCGILYTVVGHAGDGIIVFVIKPRRGLMTYNQSHRKLPHLPYLQDG